MHKSQQENGAKIVFIPSATYNILLFLSRNIVVSVTIQSAAHSRALDNTQLKPAECEMVFGSK